MKNDDVMESVVSVEKDVMTIVSIAPYITETLYELGLEDEVLAVTDNCFFPSYWRSMKPVVVNENTVDVEAIIKLSPKMVFADSNLNSEETISSLLDAGIDVKVFAINSFNDSIELIKTLSNLTNTRIGARKILDKIDYEFSKLKEEIKDYKVLKTAYMYGKEPWQVLGNDVFLTELMAINKMENVFSEAPTRVHNIKPMTLKLHLTQVVLLPDAPFKFQDDEVFILGPATRHALLYFVDHTFFTWAGARMVKIPEYFRTMNNKMRRHDAEFNIGDQ